MNKKSNRNNRGGKSNNSRRGRNFSPSRNSNKPYNGKSGSAGAKHEGVDIGEVKIDAINDPNWYKPNEQMVRDVASLPFGYRVGTSYETHFPNQAAGHNASISIPGLLVLQIIPAVGEISGATSPINVAANALYSYIRHANSGQPNGDAPDVMQYIIGMDSAYSYYMWMCRLYGTLSQYSIYNKYMPDTLLKAQHVSTIDLQTHMADFRAYINQYAYKLASLCVPKDIKFIQRHMWLFANYYTDADSTKAQIYMYAPVGFYVFSEDTPAGQPPVLNLERLWTESGQLLTLKDLQAYGNKLLNPIIGSESMNLIAGDILKAFGAGNLFKVSPIDETFSVSPIYSREVLSQIENATIGYWTDGDESEGIISCFITQDLSNLAAGPMLNAIYTYGSQCSVEGQSTPAFPNELISQRAERFINMHKDDVTPDDIMVATRLMNGMNTFTQFTGNVDDGYKCVVHPHHFASEIVLNGQIWSPHFSGSLNYDPIQIGIATDLLMFVDANGYINQNYYYMLMMLSSFDWAPLVYPSTHRTFSNQATAYVTPHMVIGDVDNMTTISMETLDNINECALLGMFSVGSMGEFTL